MIKYIIFFLLVTTGCSTHTPVVVDWNVSLISTSGVVIKYDVKSVARPIIYNTRHGYREVYTHNPHPRLSEPRIARTGITIPHTWMVKINRAE